MRTKCCRFMFLACICSSAIVKAQIPLLPRQPASLIQLDGGQNLHNSNFSAPSELGRPTNTCICPGPSYSEHQGIVHSPNYPSSTCGNVNCTYHISVVEPFKIRLKFVEFDVEAETDFLLIYDGPESKSGSLIANLTGYLNRKSRSEFYGGSKDLFLLFHSGGTTRHRGFKAFFDAVEDICGERVLQNTGAISSPNFPYHYPNSIHCTWTIMVEPTQLISLSFPIGVETEYCVAESESFVFDVVDVFEGKGIGKKRIQRLCGHLPADQPLVLNTTEENVMTVHFHSDEGVNNQGFIAVFETVQQPVAKTCLCRTERLTIPSWRPYETLNFSTPVSTDNYCHNLECIWILTVSQGYVVNLKFIEFSTDSQHDNLIIYDSSTMNPVHQLADYSGNVDIPEILSSGNTMVIKFRSDRFGSSQGFIAMFTARRSEFGFCGLQGIFLESGYTTEIRINSPRIISGGKLCIWSMRTQGQNRVKIDFDDFQAFNGTNLVVCNGKLNGSSAEVVGAFKKLSSSRILSNKNELVVKFQATPWSHFTGKVSSVAKDFCDFDLILDPGASGKISPSDFDVASKNLKGCTLNLKTFKSSNIMLSLERFKAGSAESLSIYAGLKAVNSFLVKLSGGLQPAMYDVISVWSSATISFDDNFYADESSFTLRYSVSSKDEASAPQLLSGAQGLFVSPNYPSDYTSGLNQKWNIKASPGKGIQLTFSRFSTETDVDFVSVLEDKNKNSLGKFSGNHNSLTVTSCASEIDIVFQTDNWMQLQGFVAHYKQVDPVCSSSNPFFLLSLTTPEVAALCSAIGSIICFVVLLVVLCNRKKHQKPQVPVAQLDSQEHNKDPTLWPEHTTTVPHRYVTTLRTTEARTVGCACPGEDFQPKPAVMMKNTGDCPCHYGTKQNSLTGNRMDSPSSSVLLSQLTFRQSPLSVLPTYDDVLSKDHCFNAAKCYCGAQEKYVCADFAEQYGCGSKSVETDSIYAKSDQRSAIESVADLSLEPIYESIRSRQSCGKRLSIKDVESDFQTIQSCTVAEKKIAGILLPIMEHHDENICSCMVLTNSSQGTVDDFTFREEIYATPWNQLKSQKDKRSHILENNLSCAYKKKSRSFTMGVTARKSKQHADEDGDYYY